MGRDELLVEREEPSERKWDALDCVCIKKDLHLGKKTTKVHRKSKEVFFFFLKMKG